MSRIFFGHNWGLALIGIGKACPRKQSSYFTSALVRKCAIEREHSCENWAIVRQHRRTPLGRTFQIRTGSATRLATTGSVGSRRVMPRADGPAEGDDSKETNIAVVNPVTEAGCARGSVDNGDWNLEGNLRMQRNKGISGPHMLIKIIEDSKIPLGEEEVKLHSIKGKVERDMPLSREDEAFLNRLVERANEWQRGTKSSEDTEPTDTVRMRMESWDPKK